jgi:hypothetical protein
MRTTIFSFGILAACASLVGQSNAEHAVDGCMIRPACGKVCRLVCETNKLQAVGYGYKCESICIPGVSRHGCKHCDMTCCAGDDIEGCPPKIEFCWYDWFACGCAKPRTVKVLTKYQAEREVNSYHWEVVDAECCDCVSKSAKPAGDGAIFKPAPADAQLGDVFAVTDAEWAELAPRLNPSETPSTSQVAEQSPPALSAPASGPEKTAEASAERTSVAERLQGLLRR